MGRGPQRRTALRGGPRGGPLLIAGGAGTGKTRTLVKWLARLLDEGVAPERILLVTFSRRASAELTGRAGTADRPGLARRVVAGTFHSVAHRLLRRYGTPSDWLKDSASSAKVTRAICWPSCGPRWPRIPRRFPAPTRWRRSTAGW